MHNIIYRHIYITQSAREYFEILAFKKETKKVNLNGCI